MYLVVFATIAIALISTYTQVLAVGIARIAASQTSVAQEMVAWHSAAVSMAASLIDTNTNYPASYLNGCSLANDKTGGNAYPRCPAPININVSPTPLETNGTITSSVSGPPYTASLVYSRSSGKSECVHLPSTSCSTFDAFGNCTACTTTFDVKTHEFYSILYRSSTGTDYVVTYAAAPSVNATSNYLTLGGGEQMSLTASDLVKQFRALGLSNYSYGTVNNSVLTTGPLQLPLPTGATIPNGTVALVGFPKSLPTLALPSCFGAPDMTITKGHTPANFMQGDVGDTYTIVATNSGNCPTNGSTITVNDTLPGGAGLTSTGFAGPGWTCGAVTCTRNDTIPAYTSYPPLTFTVNVAANAPAPAVVTNVATVSGGGETNTGNDTASDPTNIMCTPDMTIAATHASTGHAGNNFMHGDTAANGDTITITAKNSALACSTTGATVTVTDTLPAGLTAASYTGAGWACNLGTLTCTRSDILAANTSYPPIVFTMNVAMTTATGALTNQVQVAGGGETNTSNDTASDTLNILLKDCTGTPWGTITSGSSIPNAYLTATPACNVACSSQSRLCTDGTLSGSYTATTCTPMTVSHNGGWQALGSGTWTVPACYSSITVQVYGGGGGGGSGMFYLNNINQAGGASGSGGSQSSFGSVVGYGGGGGQYGGVYGSPWAGGAAGAPGGASGGNQANTTGTGAGGGGGGVYCTQGMTGGTGGAGGFSQSTFAFGTLSGSVSVSVGGGGAGGAAPYAGYCQHAGNAGGSGLVQINY